MAKKKNVEKQDIIERYGRWTIISAIDNKVNKGKSKSKVLCKCDCGIIKVKRLHELKKGITTQCDQCKHKFMVQSNHPRWKGYGDVPSKYWSSLISNRSGQKDRDKKSYPIEVDIIYVSLLYEQQNKLCALSGVSISFKNKTASLDRIDNTKGYIKGNVQWVHKDINKMKSDLDQNIFIEYCCRISNEQKKNK